ncbi:hypothetical protein O7627_28365 [Solwaraspora sp. WMMD1047]|uniref:hypothetical protein n=1 Tax=Solwaraspora sp. WMMD1047 TaxID=3016102 RepID=UPI0024163231|nr:hypothetical protein [Solwaraspora sp. WMMD1047]MDG4833189.1 hypothetical protein [Solwaraspora sp. WMMD1047]
MVIGSARPLSRTRITARATRDQQPDHEARADLGSTLSSGLRRPPPERDAAGQARRDAPETTPLTGFRGTLSGFIRRVPAKLTYPTYSGMHTLVVGFLTVSTHY